MFEFGQLRHRTFRYGLLTTLVLAMGQLGLVFALPVFLQDGLHLSAQTNGLWILPTGVCVIAGAQLGGGLTHRVGTTIVVRLGLTLETIGLLIVALDISPDVTFLALFPGLVFFGAGIGFASSQLTNVVLSDISPDRSGAASGANTTVRQVGSGLGVAIIGSVLTTQTIRQAVRSLGATASLPADVRAQSILLFRRLGPNFRPPAGTSPHDAATLNHVLVSSLAAGTRPALIFAAAVVGTGALLSLLIPRIGHGPPPHRG